MTNRKPLFVLAGLLLCLWWMLTWQRGGAQVTATAAPKQPNSGYMLLRPSRGRIDLAQSILKSKTLAGVSLRDHWATIEPQPGNFNLDRLRAAALKCRQAGKTYTILVESGTQSPLWLKSMGCQTVTVPLAKWDNSNQLPVPWHPVFKERYRLLANALGAEFDSDPYCVKVVAGGPTRRSNELNLKEGAISRLPNAAEQFVGAWYDCLDMYGEAFPNTPISLQLGVSFAGKQATERVAKYHAEEHGHARACFEWCALNAKPGATDYLPYVLTSEYGGRGYMTGAEQVQATTFAAEYGGSGSRQQKFDYSRNRLRMIGGDYMVIYEPDLPLIKSPFIPK